LEEWFGAPLFRRHAGRLQPTEAGANAYRWAKETLSRAISVRRFTQELALGGAGRLVVATSLGIGTYIVPAILSELASERPGADVTVRTSQPEQAIQALENGEADFAVVTWYEQVLPTTLRVEHLRAEPVWLCAAADGLPAGDAVSRHDLERLPLVGTPVDVALSRALDAQLRAGGVGSLNVVMRLGHAESIKEAIYAHGWSALMPGYAMARDVDEGKLRLLSVEGVSLTENLALVTHRDVELSPFQSLALDAVRTAMSDHSSSGPSSTRAARAIPGSPK
jgi:LysR family transcriptional regulator, low CO2-responsive transcriptional regulator